MSAEPPWDDCKVAFSAEDDAPIWRQWGPGNESAFPLPAGWSLAGTDGTGARPGLVQFYPYAALSRAVRSLDDEQSASDEATRECLIITCQKENRGERSCSRGSDMDQHDPVIIACSREV